MKKILTIIILSLITVISCNKNNNTTGSTGTVGEIKINPLGYTPLSALYSRDSVNTAPVTVTVKGQYGEADLVHTYPAGYGTEFPIHGMYANIENTIIVNDGGTIVEGKHNPNSITLNNQSIKNQYTINTDKLPPEDQHKNNPDMYFLSMGVRGSWNGVIAVSRSGYVRYANSKMNYISKVDIKDSKEFVLYNMDEEIGSGIYDMLGNQLVDLKYKPHHELLKKGSGYLYLANSTLGMEDRLIETDNSGMVKQDKNFGTLIKNIVKEGGNNQAEVAILNKIVFDEANPYDNNGTAVDWCHANACVYDSSSDMLYVSSRHHAVMAIKYTEWKLKWWLVDNSLQTGSKVGYGGIPYQQYFKDLPSMDKYRVKGDIALNDGPKNQHAVFLLANGNIAMFDNQGDDQTGPKSSRYVEYKITGDETKGYTASKEHEYRDTSLYSQFTSDVDYTIEGNILITYGVNTGIVREVKKDSVGTILFDLEIGKDSWIYRTDKLPLYYETARKYSEDSNLKQPLTY